MQAARQMGSGLIYALISIVLVLGGLSLSLAEGRNSIPPSPTPGLTPLPQTGTPVPFTQVITATPPLGITSLVIPSQTQTSSALVNCTPPSGWILITVQSGESFSILAARYHISPELLEQANCLSASQNLPPGYGIFVPPLPTNTAIPCGPFPGWIRGYTVQSGDTLFHIATIYRTTLGDLERANCKSNSTIIFAGERLWVPNVPTITPGVTLIPIFDTPTEFPTEPLTLTPLPDTATSQPTDTSEPVETAMP
jgi:LysM repeat protein